MTRKLYTQHFSTMKLSYLFGALAAAAAMTVAVSSCESPSRLASHIEGQWSGTTERITDTDFSYVTMTPAYEFVRNAEGDRTSGTVSLTAQIDVSMPADGFPVDSVGETPVSFSVAAVVTASGTWKAMDDDEIAVSFTPATVLSSIDSKAVCEFASPLMTTDKAQTVELPKAVIDAVDRQLTSTMRTYVGKITEIDDVKIKGTFMKCEIGKRDYTFSKI